MKKTVGYLLVFLFILIVLLPFIKSYFGSDTYNVSFKNVGELQQYLAYDINKPPLIGAHRGGPMPGFPENAIPTFENTLKYAPCLIECDVRKTADGALVMMHDNTLERTTTGKGRVAEHSLQELKALNLVDGTGQKTEYKIPTFNEVLNWAVHKAILEIDVKNDVSSKEILLALNEQKALAYAVVITYNIEQLIEYKNIHPELMISASAHTIEGVQRILDTGINPRRLLVFVGVTEPDPEVYSFLHSKGIRAILGTMHNIDNSAEKRGVQVYRDVLSRGADILATDNVPLAARAIREFFDARAPQGVK